MKSLIVYMAKKYAISAVNDVLKKYQGNVLKVTDTITLWINRLEKIIAQLKVINERVADGEITSEEIDKSTDEIEQLIKEF